VLPKLNNGYLELGDTAVPFELRRSRRRHTLGLTVTAEQIRIHAPSWTPRAEIENYVRQQRDWLRRAWARMQTHISAALGAEPTPHLYLGCRLTLQVHHSLFAEVRRTAKVLHIYTSPGTDIDALVQTWQYTQAAKVLRWRLNRLARKLGKQPARFALSKAQTQWGSCTSSGHIRLNWRLIQAPLALIDYVAAHELAHLIHMNHSPRFWAQVAQLCPDTLSRRATLRHMSPSLFQI